MAGVVKWVVGKFKEVLVSLSSDVSGVLPVANGGTSKTDRTLENAANKKVFDWQNKQFYDGAAIPVLTLEWGARRLIHANGTQVLDWSSGTIRDAVGFPSILWASRVLQDALGVTVLSWTAKTLTDATSKISVNWDTRIAFDAAATPKISINWSSRFLTDTAETLSVSWASRILSDSDGYNALHWNSRVLTAASGVDTVNWENKELFDTDGLISFRWHLRKLIDPDGVDAIRFGVGQRKLISAADAVSVDWEARLLKDSSGVTAVDWFTRILGGAWSAVSAIRYAIYDCVNVANVFTTHPAEGKIQRVNMVANSTMVMGTTGVYDGQQMIIEVKQSGAANYTLTLPTAAVGDCKFGTQVVNTNNVQSATFGHVAIIGLIYNATKQRWMVTSCVGGY